MDWLIAPIDQTRVHENSFAVFWHGRLMVLAWAILAPLAVIIARFFKVMPGQDWPRVLDNPVWWRVHWMGNSAVAGLTLVGFALVWWSASGPATAHNRIGFVVLGLLFVQVLLAVFRGSKGGPTAPTGDGSLRGDHYDMTLRRRVFEVVHKSLGYCALFLAAPAILSGLWKANAPVWIWIVIGLTWILTGAVFVLLQRRGRAVATYHAIWGDAPSPPGNCSPKTDVGMRWFVPDDKDTTDRRQSDQRGLDRNAIFCKARIFN